MTDNDLIRKSDALVAAHEADSLELQLHGASKIADRIAALPAVTVGVEWRNIETAPRGGEWFIARTEHGTTRVVRYADEYDRFPISHDGVVWPTAPTEWTPLKPVLAALEPVTAPDLTDPATVHANMLRGSIAKPTVEQIIHLYGREAFQPMIDAAVAKVLEEACLAVSEHADWPEDERGRTEQVELFARVINAIRAITPAENVAAPNLKRIGTGLYETQPAPAEDAKAKGETDGQVLERLGMDGAKWAAEFRTTALRLGYSDMDEGWLIGWFCNAIMAGYDRKPAPEPVATTIAKEEQK